MSLGVSERLHVEPAGALRQRAVGTVRILTGDGVRRGDVRRRSADYGHRSVGEVLNRPGALREGGRWARLSRRSAPRDDVHLQGCDRRQIFCGDWPPGGKRLTEEVDRLKLGAAGIAHDHDRTRDRPRGSIQLAQNDRDHGAGSHIRAVAADAPEAGRDEIEEVGAANIISTAALHAPLPVRVIHDRCIQYPCRSMSVVTPIAALLLGAAK
jgi:hypothetical protein